MSRKKSFLLLLVKSIFLVAIVGIAYLNISLYYKPQFVSYNKAVYHQLKYLQGKLHQGAGAEMQALYPEGFVFMHCLYGLSWCNLIQPLDDDSKIFREGMEEVNWAIQQALSPEGKTGFNEALPLPYGAFYVGWTHYLLGRKLLVSASENWEQEEVIQFKVICAEIARAMAASDSPFLESYAGQAWPADMVLAVSCLVLHDRLFPPMYEETIHNWVAQVKNNLDPGSGLIPHSADPVTGRSIAGARGSSQSLMLNFLDAIDPAFAREQFHQYYKLFMTTRLGLPAIREFPKGKTGSGDIDSGPVIFGIGSAATIVGQSAMGVNGRWNTFAALRNCIEAFGLGFTFRSKKRYLLGKLPMADAFIAWSNSLENKAGMAAAGGLWRVKFHLISTGLLGFIVFAIMRQRRTRRNKHLE